MMGFTGKAFVLEWRKGIGRYARGLGIGQSVQSHHSVGIVRALVCKLHQIDIRVI